LVTLLIYLPGPPPPAAKENQVLLGIPGILQQFLVYWRALHYPGFSFGASQQLCTWL